MRTLTDGVSAGFIGAFTVAGWFLMLDVDRGQPLATPALLDAVLLHGLRDPATLHVTPRLVAEYSVIHFAGFVAFGAIVSWLIAAVEREPDLKGGVIALLVCFEFFFLALIGALSYAALETLVWWRVIMANFLATAAMFAFFGARHPVMSVHFRLQPRHR